MSMSWGLLSMALLVVLPAAASARAESQAERDRLFDALVAAIESRNADAIATLSRVPDIMRMRGYAIISSSELLSQLDGCAIASTMRPTVEGGMAGIRFSCPGRAGRVALQRCDSGDLFLGAVPKQGRLQLSLDERRRMEGDCIPLAPPPPQPRPRP